MAQERGGVPDQAQVLLGPGLLLELGVVQVGHIRLKLGKRDVPDLICGDKGGHNGAGRRAADPGKDKARFMQGQDGPDQADPLDSPALENEVRAPPGLRSLFQCHALTRLTARRCHACLRAFPVTQ